MMLPYWANTTSPFVASNTVKTCVLYADSQADPGLIAKLAHVAVSGEDKHPFREWYLFSNGLHAYRTGKFAEALAACRESRQRNARTPNEIPALTADNLTVEAMCLHRMGNADAARKSLDEAKQLLDDRFFIPDNRWWHDWLVAHILYREAETVIEGPRNESK